MFFILGIAWGLLFSSWKVFIVGCVLELMLDYNFQLTTLNNCAILDKQYLLKMIGLKTNAQSDNAKRIARQR